MKNDNPYKASDSGLTLHKKEYKVNPEKKDTYLIMTIVHFLIVMTGIISSIIIKILLVLFLIPIIFSGMKFFVNLISYLAARKMTQNESM